MVFEHQGEHGSQWAAMASSHLNTVLELLYIIL